MTVENKPDVLLELESHNYDRSRPMVGKFFFYFKSRQRMDNQTNKFIKMVVKNSTIIPKRLFDNEMYLNNTILIWKVVGGVNITQQERNVTNNI
jgi:hypothetical protein